MKNIFKCENCGIEIFWKKNRNAFQTETSQKYYHSGKRGRIWEIATWCSRRCYRKMKKNVNLIKDPLDEIFVKEHKKGKPRAVGDLK